MALGHEKVPTSMFFLTGELWEHPASSSLHAPEHFYFHRRNIFGLLAGEALHKILNFRQTIIPSLAPRHAVLSEIW